MPRPPDHVPFFIYERDWTLRGYLRKWLFLVKKVPQPQLPHIDGKVFRLVKEPYLGDGCK